MYVRKKTNKSGSTSVMLEVTERVAGKKYPVARMIKGFGSARDNDAIEALYKEAQAYKAHLESMNPKAEALKIVSDKDLKSCNSRNTGFSDVYGSCFDKVFANFDMKKEMLSKLRDLSVMRIAQPASKLKTTNISSVYGIEIGNVDSIYKFMNKLDNNTITAIKKQIYKNTAKLLATHKEKIDVLFYDLTTIYFETSAQRELCDFGFSKDGKHAHVQIMLAVIVTKEGLPIDYEEFPGNCFEGHTLIPVLEKIKERYKIDNVVLVADAGLMNKINLQELDKREINYVIAARIKHANKEVKHSILDPNNYMIINKHDEDEIIAKLH